MSSTKLGDIHISRNVLLDLISRATLECYGVAGMAESPEDGSVQRFVPILNKYRGIVLDQSKDGVAVDVYIAVEHGTNINVVSQNLMDQISFYLTTYAQVSLKSVQVHVQEVRIRK